MKAPGPERGTSTVSLIVLCQVVHTLTFMGLALLLPLIREDLGLTFAEAGMLSVAASLSYAAGQVPAGHFADRFGARRLFFVGLMGWSVLCIALALMHAYWVALVTLFLAGAFRALLFAPGLKLLSSWFPPQRRALAMSLYMVGGFAGTIVLATAGPPLAEHYGWRMTFGLFAALGVLAALAYIAFAREKPHLAPGEQVRLADTLRLLKHRILWICSAIQYVRFSVVTAFNFWLPSFLVADHGFSLQAAGVVVALGAVLSTAANALGGYISDRLRNPPLIIGGSLAVLAVSCVALATAESLPGLIAAVALISVFMPFYFGPLFFVPVEVLGQARAGTATGFTNLFANLGGLVTAYALGAVKDTVGSFAWGFIGVGALCLVGVALTVLLARVRSAALAGKPLAETPYSPRGV